MYLRALQQELFLDRSLEIVVIFIGFLATNNKNKFFYNQTPLLVRDTTFYINRIMQFLKGLKQFPKNMFYRIENMYYGLNSCTYISCQKQNQVRHITILYMGFPFQMHIIVTLKNSKINYIYRYQNVQKRLEDVQHDIYF